MRFPQLIHRSAVLVVTFALLLVTSAACASQELTTRSPALLAKSWLMGYALVFLAILLGLLAVLLSSMRKTLRKRE